ncbi:cytochrome P460 family protein [Maribacter sp. 2308TA10-17]|uniref:cytochrome P460 family protein n=1 Tax=Maribacter sp. 2308TA10-17 TaxID=3386276 RepID=UPI0039BC59E0
MTNRFNIFVVLGFLILFQLTSCIDPKEEYVAVTHFTIDANGELERPTGYRSWVYVGTPVTPNDMNDGKAPFPEMHNVYIDPHSFDHYKKTGKFREGTILVKELVSIGSKTAVSGNGYFAGEFIGLEASVKSKELFPDEPGNWAIFSFTNPEEGTLKQTAAAFPAAMCNTCHQSNAEDDYVFTQYYPVLRAAKGIGMDISPEDNPERKASKKEVSIWDATVPTPEGLVLEIPLERNQLFAYLKEGKYKAYKNQEKELHPSEGPHQKVGLPVKVFINDILAKSLEAGNAEHPLGSVSVKEMYNEDNQPAGWAVFAKTHDKTDGGNGWFWYEVTDSEDATKIAAIGNGVIGCTSCHTIGKDMVRSKFPLN